MKAHALLLLCGTLALHANPEVEKLVVENRRYLEAAFQAAEAVTVHVIESRTAEKEIWKSTSREEARYLHRFFRPVAPKFEVRSVDGKQEVFLLTQTSFLLRSVARFAGNSG